MTILLGSRKVYTAGVGGAAYATQLAIGKNIPVSNAIGAVTNIASTDKLSDVLEKMFNPVVVPTLTLSGGELVHEIGSNIAPTLVPTWAQLDAGNATEYRLRREGTTIWTNPTPANHTVASFQLLTNVTFDAQVDHLAGRIPEGTVTSGGIVFTPQRMAFFGRITHNAISTGTAWIAAANSATIRALPGTVLNPTNETTLTVVLQPTDFGCVFVYPATLREATSIVPASFPMDMKAAFAHGIIPVEGANGSLAINYRVYVMINAGQMGANEQYTLTI